MSNPEYYVVPTEAPSKDQIVGALTDGLDALLELSSITAGQPLQIYCGNLFHLQEL